MKLPDEPRDGFSILEWARQVLRYLRSSRITSVVGGRIKESPNGSILEIIHPLPDKIKKRIKPPLYITLIAKPGDPDEDPPDWEVFAQYGHVVPKHNASGQSGAPYAITDLPTIDAPLAVVTGSKLWVTIDIDEYGLLTGASFNSATSWPTDDPPSLIGGDDQVGAEGARHIRIAEIVDDYESETDPFRLKCNQLHTGHIDHFQPVLLENLTTSPSTGEARVMKEWNATDGRWDFRYLSYGPGISITENDSDIEIGVDLAFNFPNLHPWKVVPNGDNTVDVLAGSLLSWVEQSLTLKEFYYYDGTAAAITVTGAGSIYGYIDASFATTADINITDSNGDTGQLMRVFPDTTDTVILAFGTSVPTGSSTFYFEIAKVDIVGGDAVVVRQVLTHNPTLASWLEPP